MAAPVLLNAISRSGRQALIESATGAVRKGGGWVDDVHFFSNLAVNLRCVVAAKDAGRLREELARLEIGLGPDATVPLDRAAARLADDEELNFSLQITFVHDEPDLRRTIPSVPG